MSPEEKTPAFAYLNPITLALADHEIGARGERALLFWVGLVMASYRNWTGLVTYVPNRISSTIGLGTIFTLEEVRAEMHALHDLGRIMFDEPVSTFWIIERMAQAYGIGGNPAKMQRYVTHELADLPSREIYNAFLVKYQHHPWMPDPIPPFMYASTGKWLPHETADARERMARARQRAAAVPDPPPPQKPVEPEPEPLPHIQDVSAQVNRVWGAYVETVRLEGGKVATLSLTADRRDMILGRLMDKIPDPATGEIRSVTAEDLVAAMSPWRGTNANPRLILGSTDKLLASLKGEVVMPARVSENGHAAPWGGPEDLAALYNEATTDNVPAVETLSAGRIKKARALLAAYPLKEWWEETFAEYHKSKFLSGRAPATPGHASFKPDFDWLLTSGKDGIENCVKVHDGRYRDDL